MEASDQSFNSAILAIPCLLALIPAFLFLIGYRASRTDIFSFAGRSLYWLAGHGVTLVLATFFTVVKGVYLPTGFVAQLPLIFTVVYLFAGFFLRSPFLFSMGLATPGLWLFSVKVWEAFTGEPSGVFMLPLEPFWYVLGAIVIFSMQYLSSPKDFWEETESGLVTISSSYFMGALWLLSLGQKSLVDGIGLVQYLWAVILVLVASFVLWCAKYMRDPLLAGCGLIGLAAGVYAFITYFPW